MGTKRVGLARIEALIENLKRELALDGSVIHYRKANSSYDFESSIFIESDGCNHTSNE